MGFLFLYYYYFFNVWMFCLHVYLCAVCLLVPAEVRRRETDPLEVKLVVTGGEPPFWFWELNLGPRQAEPFFQPLHLTF